MPEKDIRLFIGVCMCWLNNVQHSSQTLCITRVDEGNITSFHCHYTCYVSCDMCYCIMFY